MNERKHQYPSVPQVRPKTSVADAISAIPFLERFLTGGQPEAAQKDIDDFDRYCQPMFLGGAINTYLGYEFVRPEAKIVDADVINKILMVAYDRGDI